MKKHYNQNENNGRYKHGYSKHPLFPIWNTMLQRCSNPNSVIYKHYGGRGIKVCKRWHDVRNFIKDMGERPTPQHTVERINNDGDYKPSNCKWATFAEQAVNRRKGQVPKGEQHHKAKLSEDNVRQIRILAPCHPHSELANMFGVSKRAIGFIVNNINWKHI